MDINEHWLLCFI